MYMLLPSSYFRQHNASLLWLALFQVRFVDSSVTELFDGIWLRGVEFTRAAGVLTFGVCLCVVSSPFPPCKLHPSLPRAMSFSAHTHPPSVDAQCADAVAAPTSPGPLSTASSDSATAASSPASSAPSTPQPSFDFSSLAGFNFGPPAGSASALAASQHEAPKSDKTESAPVAVTSNPSGSVFQSAFGFSSASSFSAFPSFSSFPSSSSASPGAPSGFGFTSGGFGGFSALSSIPTRIQSAPALDPARSAFSKLSFDLTPAAKPPVPDVMPSDPCGGGSASFSEGSSSASAGPAPKASFDPEFVCRHNDDPALLPASVAETRRSGWATAIVPAGKFGAPTVCATREMASRSEKPMADGRTPVLPADALFSIVRFLSLADVNTILRSCRGGFAAQLDSIPCLGLSHRCGGQENMPAPDKSLVLCRHISALSRIVPVRSSFLSRIAVQLPSLRSLTLVDLPRKGQWEMHFPRLTSLDLSSVRSGLWSELGLASHLPSLRALVLSSAVADTLDLKTFAGLQCLKLPLSQISQIESIRSLAALRLLTFTPGYINTTETAGTALQLLCRRPHAMQLEEIVCELQPWNDAMIDAVGGMPSLTALRPSVVGCTRLSALRELPQLSSLHLLFAPYIARIEPADVVTGLRPCTALTQLTLGGECTLTTEHLTSILKSLTALRELEMLPLADLRCFAEAQSTLSRTLVTLTLRASSHTEPAAQEPDFAQLIGLRSLRTLQLLEWHVPLSDAAHAALRPPDSLIPSLREFVFQHSARYFGSTALPYRAVRDRK